MKKLVVSGWISFTMLIPAELFTCTDEVVITELIFRLNRVNEFSQALYDIEHFNLLPHEINAKKFMKGDEIHISADNGSLFLKLQDVDDFEVFF